MAHSLADKGITVREEEMSELCVLDQDQEEEMLAARDKLLRSRMNADRALPPNLVTKRRYRASSSCDEEPASKRLRTGMLTRREIASIQKTSKSQLDVLTDDLLIEVFKHLPQLPHILTIRQVCMRWFVLSCNPRLWRSLSFEGQEHVTSMNLDALCKKTPGLRRLKKLSLAKIHGVGDYAVRNIPRTCAATLESVDLSWCSGATDKSVVEFSRCPGLRELRLSHCRLVTRRSVRILAVRCPRLEVLDMNCIGGVRDSLLGVIGQNCPFLRVLNIANAKNVTDDGVVHVTKGCPRLEVLDLSWCSRLTDWSISKIAQNMPNLRELGLSETKVTDVGLSELTRSCTRLEALHLARCAYITNTGVENVITYCGDRLTSLNLASCQNVTDYYVGRLIELCPVLKCLDVSKLPCRVISDMLQKITASRDIQVYF